MALSTAHSRQGFIKIRGVNHYYQWISQSPVLGEKPVMVFIHGWGGSARYWQTTATALSDRFDCLLYDLRGFGRSNQIPASATLPPASLGGNYELEEYGEDLNLFLKAFSLDHVYLNAHSMGASIGTYFMNRYPQKVQGSILNCNGIFQYDPKAFENFHKFGQYVVKFRYPWLLKVPFAENLFMARFLHRPIPQKMSREFLEDFLLANEEAAFGTILSSVNKKMVEQMPKEFAQISVPTLLLSGEKDKIIPAEMGYKASQLNSKLNYIAIPKTGHFPMLERPDLYLEKVTLFLDSLSGSSEVPQLNFEGNGLSQH